MASGTIAYDWTKPEAEIVIDMIRADNQNRPLELAWITIDPPETLIPTVDETYNARILVSATPAAPFVGSQYHRYHRVDIQDFVYDDITNLVFIFEETLDLATFLTTLSDRLGAYLTSDSVEFTYPTEAGIYTVRMRDSSLCYYGELDVEFKWLQIPLPELIDIQDLPGFIP